MRRCLRWLPVESGESLLDAPRFLGATLLLVDLQRLLPRRPRLLVLAECGVGCAESGQRFGDPVVEGQLSLQREGRAVVSDGHVVLTGVMGDVAEAVEHARLTGRVVVLAVDGQRGQAVLARPV